MVSNQIWPYDWPYDVIVSRGEGGLSYKHWQNMPRKRISISVEMDP